MRYDLDSVTKREGKQESLSPLFRENFSYSNSFRRIDFLVNTNVHCKSEIDDVIKN